MLGGLTRFFGAQPQALGSLFGMAGQQKPAAPPIQSVAGTASAPRPEVQPSQPMQPSVSPFQPGIQGFGRVFNAQPQQQPMQPQQQPFGASLTNRFGGWQGMGGQMDAQSHPFLQALRGFGRVWR